MNKMINPKLKHYIATHTFHSPGKLKEFKNAFKHRKKILIGLIPKHQRQQNFFLIR